MAEDRIAGRVSGIAGLMVEHVSVDGALLTTAGCAVLAAMVLYVRRATLRSAREPALEPDIGSG